MGKAKPLSIGRMTFDTQFEAQEFIREILNSAIWGARIEGDIHDFILCLLERHPRAAEKIGPGVSYFTVDSDTNGDRCFHIHYGNGESVHFSYLKSLRGKDDVRSLVVGALNKAVDEQIWAFRDSEFAKSPQICVYTGAIITRDNYHVDHHNPTFFELYTAWMAQSGLGVADIKISDGGGNEIGRHMTDTAQRLSWQEFHRSHAHLRLLSRLGNLSGAKIETNRRIRAGGSSEA